MECAVGVLKNAKELFASINDKWKKTKWGGADSKGMKQIQKTIDRIKTRNPRYSNDGTRFDNDWRRGPNDQRLNTSGLYEEWTVKTDGVGK